MSNTPTPQEKLLKTGADLKVLDSLLIGMCSRRQDVARRVAEAKFAMTDWDTHPYGQPIFVPERETSRLSEVAELAAKYGINPNFAATLEYCLIDESCKHQMNLLQTGALASNKPTLEEMRAALLELADAVATSYEGGYTELFPATQVYTEYEDKVIDDNIAQLPRRFCALDLGCASGILSRRLATKFQKVIAVDISPAMCDEAHTRNASVKVNNIAIHNADFEEEKFWSTVDSGSVDFIVMNLGTASDVVNLPALVKHFHRVLRKDGRVVLSFYNRDALVYKAGFLPWRSSLAAVLNEDLTSLTVMEKYTLFAKAYSTGQLQEMSWSGLHQRQITTFPALLSIMPPEICINDATLQLLTELDLQRAQNGDEDGAYLLINLVR